MITDEIRPSPMTEKEKMDKDQVDAPVVNGNNVDTLSRPGSKVSYIINYTRSR